MDDKEKLLSEITYKYVKENYDYVWLKSMISRAKSVGEKRTLFTGSSHARCGIDVFCFEGAINCSLSSQDLYYDFLCARTVMESSTAAIKKCFIILSYYKAYQDLSLETNIGRRMIEKVYYPLFSDSHHLVNPQKFNLWKGFQSGDEDIKIEAEEIAQQMLMGRYQYYSDLMIRNPVYDFGNRKWREFSDEEKDEFGKKRAEDHNKYLRYVRSAEENQQILKDYVHFLKSNGCQPIVVIPPFSMSYDHYIKEELKVSLKEIIMGAGELDWIDFNKEGLFSDDDFLDMDHLNGRGAFKLSRLLVSLYGK